MKCPDFHDRRPALRPLLALLLVLAGLSGPCAPAMAQADDLLNTFYTMRQTDPEAAHVWLAEREAQAGGDVRVPLELAYHLLRKDQPADALPWFEKAVALAPSRVEVWKQIGYIRKGLGQDAAALDAFGRARALVPGDEAVVLEMAYLNQRIGRNHQAAALFGGLAAGLADREVARQACDAHTSLRGLPDKVLPEPWFAETYAAPEFNSHWDMAVLPVQARLGRVVSEAGQVEAYAGLRINADTRSTAGVFGPEIYTDNAAVGFVGLRARPVRALPLAFFAEAGHARDMTDRGRDRWRGDVRAGFQFYDEWGKQAPCGKRAGIRPIADLYVDGIYYSRYDDNVLFYARVRPGLRLADSSGLAADAYLLAAIGRDTKDRAGNAYEELGAGAALHFFRPGTLSLRAEGVRAFRHDGLDSYTTVRVRLEHFARF